MTQYVVLLRGINVGGKNKIKMADLREALGNMGLAKVQTYIQSGNILCESDEDEATLRQKIEQMIETVFGLSITAIIRTVHELKRIVERCPFSEEQVIEAKASSGVESLYVTMLLDLPDAERVEKLKTFDFKDDLYKVEDRDVFLLFYRSIRDSKLAVQVEKLGVPTTTRNWNTIHKIIALSDKM